MEKQTSEVPVITNSDLAALMMISAGEKVELSEEQDNNLFFIHRLVTRKNPCGKERVLTNEGKMVVKAMLAVAKVMTHQDADL